MSTAPVTIYELGPYVRWLWSVVDVTMTTAQGPSWQVTNNTPPNAQQDLAAIMAIIHANKSLFMPSATTPAAAFTRQEKTWLFEIRDWRNEIAHGGNVVGADRCRVFDTVARVVQRRDPVLADQYRILCGCPCCAPTTTTPAANPNRTSSNSTTKTSGSVTIDNRALAAAIRAHGVQPNGEVWERAKKLAKSGIPLDDAAKQAVLDVSTGQ
jgi:hypothetical protein